MMLSKNESNTSIDWNAGDKLFFEHSRFWLNTVLKHVPRSTMTGPTNSPAYRVGLRTIEAQWVTGVTKYFAYFFLFSHNKARVRINLVSSENYLFRPGQAGYLGLSLGYGAKTSTYAWFIRSKLSFGRWL